MTAPMDDFRLEWHGNTVIITPSPNVEQMPWDLIEEAADIVMEPLRSNTSPMAVIDLSQVKVNLFRARNSVREQLQKMNAYGL